MGLEYFILIITLLSSDGAEMHKKVHTEKPFVGTNTSNLSHGNYRIVMIPIIADDTNHTFSISKNSSNVNLFPQLEQNKTTIIKTTPNLTVPSTTSVIPDAQLKPINLPTSGNVGSVKTMQSSDSMEHIEETFTYQVKRQNKNKYLADQDILRKSDLFNLMNGRSNEDKVQVNNKIDETNKKVDGVENRVEGMNQLLSGFLKRISELEANFTKVYSNINTLINVLRSQVDTINENSKANENSTKDIRNTIALDKRHVEGQIQTLTTHFRSLHDSTFDKIQNASSILRQLQLSVQNASSEIKMNEIRTRYNQKALSTLDKSVHSNNERINEFSISVGAKWAEQTTGCGGILIAEAGVLSYKFRQPYLNNERCIWTIRVNRRSRVVLQMLEDGFQNSSNSDFITITEFTEDQPPTLITSSRIEHGNRAVHTFKGPVIFINFFSDSSISGNGFMLKFQGNGNNSAGDVLNAIRYRHFHFKNTVGHLAYPEEKNTLYQPNEIATFAINPSTNSLRVLLRYMDLEKEESCEYDSLNFYASVKASYALAKKYCEQQKAFTGEFLQSSDGTFIVVFRTDGSTQFKGFQFSWENL